MVKNILQIVVISILASSCTVLEWMSDRTKNIFGMDRHDEGMKGQESLANLPRRRVGETVGFGPGGGMPMGGGMPPMGQAPQFNNFGQQPNMGMGGLGGGSASMQMPTMASSGLPPVYNAYGSPMQGGGMPPQASMPQQNMYNPYGMQQNNAWAAMPPPSNMVSNISYTPGGLFPAAQAPGYGPVSPYVTNPVPAAYQAPQQLPQVNYDNQLPRNPGVAYGPSAINNAMPEPVDSQTMDNIVDNYPEMPAQSDGSQQGASAQSQYTIPPEASTNVQVPVPPVSEQQAPLPATSQIDGLPPIDDKNSGDQAQLDNYDPNKPMIDSGVPSMEPVQGYKQN